MHFASLYRWIVATQYWHLPQSFSGTVLDIGANDGGFLAGIRADQVVGIDLNPIACSSVPYVQSDAVELPFPSSTFQHVFAFDVLEHVVEDAAMLSEAFRVLVPTGTLWISTTARDFSVFPGGAVQRRLQVAWGHVRRGYTEQELLTKLPGGAQAKVSTWNEPWFRLAYVGLWALSRFRMDWPHYIVPRLAKLDALRSTGLSGHLFLEAVKRG